MLENNGEATMYAGNGSGGNALPIVPFAQGLYFVSTGLWPLIDIESFQTATGPKVDRWLVKTVGVLVSTMGAVLLSSAFRRKPARELPLLGVGSAAGLAAIDVVYASKKRIPGIYLLDAVVEGVLIAGWLFSRKRSRHRTNSQQQIIQE